MKQITFAQAEHQNKKKVTRRERFLAEMNVLVPWQRLLDALSPSYYPDAAGKRGRPPTPLERMLRIYFLQQWYGLADEALEDAMISLVSISPSKAYQMPQHCCVSATCWKGIH